VKDEHEGFQKLERSLAHEKGVTDPAALAASIGRKKYGAAGMAAKSAAGRVKDAERDVNSTTSSEGGATIKGIHFSAEEVKKYPRKVLEMSARTGREPWSLHGRAKDAVLPV